MKNLFAAWGGQAVSVLFVFATRSVFAYCLPMEYLGIENLFSNVLTILSLADLGIGSAITFALYKPIAENDQELIKSLMRLFKRVYITVGCAVALLGFAIAPFLELFIKDATNISDLQFYFLFFVANTAVSYFFSYKGTLIYAYQKNYIVMILQYGFKVIMCVAQIGVILLLHSYTLFLLCMFASTLIQNIAIAHQANKMFPFLKEREVKPLPRSTLIDIGKNTFALMLHRIAGVAATPASSVIVSTFVGINAVSVYGNYLLLLNSLQGIMTKVFDSIQASVGNMGATEDDERQYRVFEGALFVNAILYSVIYGAVLCSIQPFVSMWLGEQYVLGCDTAILMVLWYFCLGMRAAVQAFTSAYGLFWRSWYKAIVETVFLLTTSLALVQVWGINGVVIAGIASALLISTPIEVFVLYKYGFHRTCRRFIIQAAGYYSVACLSATAAYAICSLIGLEGIFAILVNALIGSGVAAALYYLVYSKSMQYAYFRSMIQRAARMFPALRKAK